MPDQASVRGREGKGWKKGVVREPAVHGEVIGKIMDFADFIGFEILHLDFSPIRGPEGNIEYLLHIRKNEEKPLSVTEADAETELKKCWKKKADIPSGKRCKRTYRRQCAQPIRS